MEIKGAIRVITAVVACLLLHVSCVNADYEVSEDRLNLEVTIFQDGISLPLGKIEGVYLKDYKEFMIRELGDTSFVKYLTVGENGEWGAGVSDTLDISDTLNNLLANIDIPDIPFSETFTFNLNTVDVSSLKVPAAEYSYAEKIGGMITPPEFSFGGFGTTFSFSAGLNEYRPSADELKLDLPEIDHTEIFAFLPADFSIPSGLINDTPIKVDPNASSINLPEMTVSTGLGPDICHVEFSLELPKGITSVEEIVLDKDAKVNMTVELTNSFFTSGTISPFLDFDIHEILHLSDRDNEGHDDLTIDHIIADFDLPAAGGKITRSYGIKSLALNEDDWKIVDGCLTLQKEVDVMVQGNLRYSDVYTTTRHLAGLTDRNMNIHLSLGFENFQVDDVRMAIEPVVLDVPEKTVSFKQTIHLPEQILSVEHAEFTDDSKIIMSLHPENVPSGLSLGLESLKFVFPEGLLVEGAVDGVLEYKNVDLTEGFASELKISGIVLPKPENGKIIIDEEIKVDAVVTASGVVSSASLPATEDKDLKVTVDVKADLALEDYAVSVSGYDYPVSYNQEFRFDVTGLEEFGTVAVVPQGSPQIEVEVKMPESDLQIVADPQKNLVITFPEMIEFSDLPQEYNYDKAAGTITLKGMIPSKMVLPIDRLVITPEKEDGKYWAKGNFTVEGGIAIPACTVDKADVDAIVAPDCVVGLVARMPEIKMGTLSMEDAYEKKIIKQLEVSMMSADELPDQLVSIDRVEFEDVFFNMTLDASKLPDLGSTKLSLDFEINLPEIIILDPAKVKEGNVLSVKGELDKDGKVVVEPIRIVALDLSNVDLKNLESLKDTVTVDGKVRLEDVSLDIDQWLGKSLEVSVEGGIKDISISRVTGKVDVNVDPVNATVDLTEIKKHLYMDRKYLEISGIENLLSRVNLAAEIKTNVGVPMGARMTITPYSDGHPIADGIWDTELTLNHSQSADQMAYTRYWLSNREESEDAFRPAGYNHIYFPLKQYLHDIPDSLSISLEAGTDPTMTCIIEPTQKYVMEAAYSAAVPFEFGDGCAVTYRDTLAAPDLVGQLLSYGDLFITGEVTSNLPVEVGINLCLLDSEDNVMPIDEVMAAQKIKGCTASGEPSVTDLHFGFRKKDGAQAADVRKIVCELDFSTIAGTPICDGSFISLALQLLVPDGVSADLKEFVTNNEEE